MHAISGFERPHAGRSAGQHQVAGLEGHGGGDVRQQPWEGKDEVEGRTVLMNLVVDVGREVQAGFNVEFIADKRADGAKGIEALGACPLAVLGLQVAGGDVVGQRETAHGRAPILLVEMADAAARFAGVLARDERDYAARMYLERAGRLAREGLPDGWTGVEAMETK